MNKYLIFLLTCIVAVYACGTCFSQEEDIEYSYGTVVSVNKATNEIIVSEYNWNDETNINVTYLIGPKVEVNGVKSWKDIVEGDNVDIEYVTGEDGKRIAKSIDAYEVE